MEQPGLVRPYEIRTAHGTCVAPEDKDSCVRKRLLTDTKCPLALEDGETVCGECVFCCSAAMRSCDDVKDDNDLRFKVGDVEETFFGCECDCGVWGCANGPRVWKRGVVLKHRARFKDVRAQNWPLGGCYVYPYVLYMLDNGPETDNAREDMTARIPYDNSSTVRRVLSGDEMKKLYRSGVKKPCGETHKEFETIPVPVPLPDWKAYQTAAQVNDALEPEHEWRRTCVCGSCRCGRRNKKV